MGYILESRKEFDRLEKQSQNEAYDFEEELKKFSPKSQCRILDGGCGSGIVSRHLARTYPQAEIVGCDLSSDRVTRARAESKVFTNLSFQQENLTKLHFENLSFDHVICRYVLEHLSEKDAVKALKEFHRCLRPGGEAYLVDMDGYLVNIHPQTKNVQTVLKRLEENGPVDINVGRKLPSYLTQAGFTDVTWEIQTLQFRDEMLATEIVLIRERFAQVLPFLEKFLDGAKKAQKFVNGYLRCLDSPDAVLFYNKFIVRGKKPGLKPL